MNDFVSVDWRSQLLFSSAESATKVNEDIATTNVEEKKSMMQERDRDCIGSVNITQKGIYTLIGNPISAFERST